MFYWIIYIIFVLVGEVVYPYPLPHIPAHASNDGPFVLFGTTVTTIFFGYQIKYFKKYRYVPGICVIGFFSYLPAFAVAGIFVLGGYILNYFTPQ